MKRSLLLLLMCSLSYWGQAQTTTSVWTTKQLDQIEISNEHTAQTFAYNYRLVELDREQFAPTMLSEAKSVRQIIVPLPNGKETELNIQLDQVMAPGLASRYPGIKTYKILPSKHIMGGRLGWTYQGFHATIRTDEGVVYIDPYTLESDQHYVVYNVRDNIDPELWGSFECGNQDNTNGNLIDTDELFPPQSVLDSQDKSLTGAPVLLRTYRIAMACTGQFSEEVAGSDTPSVEISLSAIVTIINRVNEVWMNDLSVRVELVENNDAILFLDPATDPYIGVNNAANLLATNPGVLNTNIGLNGYDIGHVISRSSSSADGLASLVSICDPERKGAAASTKNVVVGDPFTINILLHEMGHQAGAAHVTSGCQNVNPPTAVEPGGGSTIMSYAGICAAGYNIQANADDYYNAHSLEQIFNYIREGAGATCGTTEDFNNTNPDVTLDYEDDFFIPISTPFVLTGVATDMEGDELTYTWEEIDFELSIFYDDDNGIFGPLPGSPVGNSPLFRSLYPSDSPTRVFPNMTRIVTNTSNVDEVLPTYSRRLTFRFSARDNNTSNGGISWSDVAFRATETAGPFLVMSPNDGSESWNVGDYTEVTWDVAATDTGVVNCQFVNILLSTDGGYTYPIALAENTPNNGSAFVTVPDAISNSVRIRVEAVGNVFFDISNTNFSIEAATEAGYTLDNTPLYQEVCSSDIATIDFTSSAILGFEGALTLDIPDLQAGVIASFTPTTLQAGEAATLSLDFSNSGFDGYTTIEVRAITAEDTIYRSFNIEVFNNDFSALALSAPADGLGNVVLSENFSWTTTFGANSYDIQIAYGPDFDSSLFEEAFDLENPTYTPSGLFEDNSLVFWRVRANNECGHGEWTMPFTLHTQSISCSEFTSQDTPMNIPGTGALPTITSIINVGLSGSISDLNISAADVIYSPVQNFKVKLINPANDIEVVLYNSTCFSTDRIFAGFDDEAPNTLVCPPTNGIVYQPFGSLADFIGSESEGEWKLEVKVHETGNGSSGTVNDWTIEFCTSSTAISPTILTNESLCVRPLMSNPIQQNILNVTDADQNPAELQYTIVTTPEHGTLSSTFGELGVGSTFRQATIDASNLYYENTNGAATEDAFTFVVEDGTGGFLPVQQFNIIIEVSCTVGTNELTAANQFRLFPNPASESVTLEWGEATKDSQVIKVYNLQGQLISTHSLATGLIQWKLDVRELPAGVYAVQVGLHTERLIIH